MTDEILRCPADPELDRRIAASYAVALKTAHEGGNVHIAAGTVMLDYLQSRATVEVKGSHGALCASLSTLWGFPIVPAEVHADPDHLSVRTITVIP